MPRTARIVVPEIPHHITQRGNRNQPVFFTDDDRREYLKLVSVYSRESGVRIWAYCLMTNHVHFVAVPEDEKALTQCFMEVHRRYTRLVNLDHKWRGYLWQGRYASYVMDERYLLAAVRYVENNPVKAGLVARAEDYPWSSAKAHVGNGTDSVLSPCYLTEEIRDWSAFLRSDEDPSDAKKIALHSGTGRPLGDGLFVHSIEDFSGRHLTLQKPGPKPKACL